MPPPAESPAALPESEVTVLLKQAAAGDMAASDRVFSLLYHDLRQHARSRLWQSGEMTSLDTTGLVHEAFLRLRGVGARDFPDRKHFLAYAARAMRSVVVDMVRARQAQRRGAAAERVTFDPDIVDAAMALDDEVMRVHEGLEALAAVDERLGRVVELRYFCGMSDAEVAACLEVTERTVRRDWQKARLYLQTALR
jgi:RNA polymerase sigma factor (TIGR02999 family)